MTSVFKTFKFISFDEVIFEMNLKRRLDQNRFDTNCDLGCLLLIIDA